MKKLTISRKIEFKNIASLSLVCLFFLGVRLKLDYSPNKFFILWNLFLAFIPYLLSLQLQLRKQISHVSLIISLIIWICFLPNAFYIITDLKHIKIVEIDETLFESLFILSFAITGIYLGFLSLRDILKTLHQNGWIKLKLSTFLLQNIVLILCAYGIYLGRVLRWNSWDIIKEPMALSKDILSLFIHFKEHSNDWLFIISLSVFLIITFPIFQSNSEHTIKKENSY